MTENLAGRGEGLAGAISCIKEFIAWATEQIGTSEAHGCAEQAEDALRRLLAAAPAGTAPPQRIARQMLDLVDLYVVGDDGNYHAPSNYMTPEQWTALVIGLEEAALATPSPQAPQEQCNAFSPTSAREQSSATASDSLDVAAQTILKPHWPCVRNMEESEARRQEVLRVVGILNALTWQAAKEESDKWYEACRNPRADDPRAYCISKAVRK